jgi:hypothetical protein
MRGDLVCIKDAAHRSKPRLVDDDDPGDTLCMLSALAVRAAQSRMWRRPASAAIAPHFTPRKKIAAIERISKTRFVLNNGARSSAVTAKFFGRTASHALSLGTVHQYTANGGRLQCAFIAPTTAHPTNKAMFLQNNNTLLSWLDNDKVSARPVLLCKVADNDRLTKARARRTLAV